MASFNTHHDPKKSRDRSRFAFDDFELDLRSGELRKKSRKIRLQAQPFQLLVLLVQNAGEVVTREQVCQALWPTDTFVDFDHGLAVAVNKAREALGDSADNPQYIETLPKRGYRFIGTIKPEPPVLMPAPERAKELEKLAVVAATRKEGNRNRILALAAVGILAASVAFMVGWKPHSAKEPRPVNAVRFTSYPGLETAPAISPDGTRIAFSWDNDATNKTGKPAYDLYVKAVGSETLLRLTNHPADWISSTWSPDGTQIAFHRLAQDDNGIYVVPAMGGPERKLLATHAPYDLVAPLSWSPDGKWIAFADRRDGANGDRTYLLNTETLEVRTFPHDTGCIHEGSLTFSHSGKELAHLCVHNLNSIEFIVSDLEGKSRRSLGIPPGFPQGFVWSGDNQSLVVAESTSRGTIFREIHMDRSARVLPLPAGSWPTLADSGGRLAYAALDTRINIWRKDLLHPEASPEELLTSSRMQNIAQYSPDGKHLVFDSDRSGVWSIWLADADASNLVQVTHDRPAGYPRWSPDSQRIAFAITEDNGSEAVYTVNIADLVPHKLETGLQASSAPSWSPDGKWIYFGGFEGAGHQIYRCPSQGGQPALVASGLEYIAAIPSEDGNTLYITWSSAESYMDMLSLDRPGAVPRRIPHMPELANSTQWAVAANGIYFTPLDKPRSVWFYNLATQNSHEVFQAAKDLSDGMSLSPDGRYMLYSQVDEIGADIMLVKDFQ